MKKINNKKLVLIILLPVVTCIIAGGILLYNNKRSSSPEIATPTDSGVNYGPPTETELQEADRRKTDIIEDQKNEQTKNTVTPTITSASTEGSQIVVRGFVTGVVENGKDCIFVFRKSDQIVNRTSSSVANASTTNCGITIDRNVLDGTEWSVLLKYSSGQNQGESKESLIEGM